MRLSTHAKERWQQRCSHLDLEAEWAAQRSASKRLLNMLRRSWERSQGVGTWPAHYDYWVTPFFAEYANFFSKSRTCFNPPSIF
jgi:hypothetical protein